jgi:hypothetical protein
LPHSREVEGRDDTPAAAGFLNVYTPQSTIKAQREMGKLPDSAVPAKAIAKAETGDLATGDLS